MKVEIISSSIRNGRKSHSVAKFLENWFKENTEVEVNIIDLKERNYPIFPGRLAYMEEEHPGAVKFAQEIKEADAVIMVCPEYNGSFTPALKNVIDLLFEEWKNKPVGMALVSGGDMAGAQAAEQLQFVMYKIGALVANSRFHVGNVTENFNEDGTSNNPEFYNKYAKAMWKNLQQFMVK